MKAENVEHIDNDEYDELRKLAEEIEERLVDLNVRLTLTLYGEEDGNHAVHVSVFGGQATANVASRLNDLSSAIVNHAVTESGRTHFTFSVWLGKRQEDDD